ncbi:MAG: ABC transporter substrate-binding protein [bacterium]
MKNIPNINLKDWLVWYKNKKWPSKKQWCRFFNILNAREKIVFALCCFLTLGSAAYLGQVYYLSQTEIGPIIEGEYSEGAIGQPRFINPVYISSNDIDRDLTKLLFSGLMKYDSEGKLVPDLAKDYKVDEEGKIFEFSLKENIYWHDGEELTVDDIIFTIETIQNPDYKSPLRANWLGVDMEKISKNTIRFSLTKPYNAFLERLTLKIMPAHIWEKIPAENFHLTKYNLQPIGSGPYEFEKMDKDELGYIKSLEIKSNSDYFGKQPFIPKITFYFFQAEENLIKAAKQKQIKGFSLSSSQSYSLLNNGFSEYEMIMPRYFAVFFNTDEENENSKIFNDERIRRALNYATNKEELRQKLLDEKYYFDAQIVDSPVLPQIYGYDQPENIYEFDLAKAKDILDKTGFVIGADGLREKTTKKDASFQINSNLKSGDQGLEVKEMQKCLAQDPEVYPEANTSGYFGKLTKDAVIRFQEKYANEILKPAGLSKGTGTVGSSTRAKINELCFKGSAETTVLKFSLVTVQDSILEKAANILKDQWEKSLGIEVEIKSVKLSDLERDIIKQRDYDCLLFGEVLGLIPDPFAFWHSYQKEDPGLNLSSYTNEKVDRLLEDARQTVDPEITKEKLEEFQNILISDTPAIFLYNPNVLYLVSPEIKGVEAGLIANLSERFSNVEDWYIKTARHWK